MLTVRPVYLPCKVLTSGTVVSMTEVKALAAPPKFLALPDYSEGLASYFVEPQIVDSMVADLAELVSTRVAELRLEHAQGLLDRCRQQVFEAATDERYQSRLGQIHLRLNDFIMGASLVVNPLPKRKHRHHLTDYEALHSDYWNAFSDANKVWNTFAYCLQPLVKNPSDDTIRRFRRKKHFAAGRRRPPA